MGIFQGIEKAEITERGKYIAPGFVGTLKVTKTLAKESLKSGLAFIVEFNVLASNLEEHPIGSSVTWFQKMTDRTIAFPAIKAFVAAVAGFHPGDKAGIDAEIGQNMSALLDDATENETNNALVGQTVKCGTFLTKTKKGFDFTAHKWAPAD